MFSWVEAIVDVGDADVAAGGNTNRPIGESRYQMFHSSHIDPYRRITVDDDLPGQMGSRDIFCRRLAAPL